MPITLITGPANSGKAEIVFAALRGCLARGEEPILVVPTEADAEHYLRELSGGGAVMGLRVERFRGLIDEVCKRTGSAARTLGELGRRRLLASLAESAGLADTAPGRGLLRGLEELVSELEVRAVTPQRFAQALGQWESAQGEEPRAGALAGLYRAYRAALERMGRLDPAGRSRLALDALRREPALWGATPVLLYGFDSLTDQQLDVVETLGRVVDTELTLALAYEPGRVAFAGRALTFASLEPLASSHRRLAPREDHYAPGARAALSHLERSLFEDGAARRDGDGALLMLEGGGERAELELVAREVRALLDDGMSAGDIAVSARSIELVADLLEEVLTAHGIPYALQRRRTLRASAVGRALLGILRCVPRPGEQRSGGSLADLLAWLRSPGMLEHPELADRLELGARGSGAMSADAARELWEARHWPLDRIERMRVSQERGRRALLQQVDRELTQLFAAPHRAQAALLEGSELQDAAAMAACRRALSELGELLQDDPRLVPQDAAGLAGLLEHVEFVAGRAPAPDAVAVLEPLALRARRVRALFLCGLQEGVFPARGRGGALLDDEDRRRIAELSGLALAREEDALAAERYLLYAAISRPEQLLALSWHSADDEGLPTPRSLFVEDVCDLFEESLLKRRRRRSLGEIDLPASAGGAPAASRQPAGRLRVREPGVLGELRARSWSASSLELWLRCPVRWFVERMLAPTELDPDEELLNRGALAHAALRDTFAGLRERTGSARLDPAKLELARELLGEALARHEDEHPLSLAPERVPGTRRRLRAELERYLEYCAQAESPLEPAELELGFGFEAEEGSLPAFELDEELRLRGRIDRIDVSAAGDAVVYDYKSSARAPAGGWIAGGNVQVALYMLAAEALLQRPVAGGFYQPLRGDLTARGVLDAGSGIELGCVRTDLLEADQMRELLHEALAMSRGAARQARDGQVRALPDSCGFSRAGCAYPAICRCGR